MQARVRSVAQAIIQVYCGGQEKTASWAVSIPTHTQYDQRTNNCPRPHGRQTGLLHTVTERNKITSNYALKFFDGGNQAIAIKP